MGAPILVERGSPRTMDISSTTRSLLSSPMSAEGAKAQSVAYQNLGQGVSDLGKGLGKAAPVIGQKVAAVLQHWQQTKTEATDSDSRVQLHQLHDTALDTFQKNIAGQPEPVIQQEYARLQETTTKGFAALKFSEPARADSTTYHAQRLQEATLLGARAGYAQFAEQGKANATSLYQSLMQKRNFADAERVLSGAVQAGFLFKDSAQNIERRAHTDLQRQDMDTFVANNPFGAREVIAEIRQTGKNPHFSLLTPEEIANSDIRAQASIRDLQRRTSDEIDTAILAGQARDEATIRALAAPARLSEEELKSHVAGLREVSVNTSEKLFAVMKNRNLLMTTLANYDPALDTDDRGYLDIKKTIREKLPMAERETAMAELQKRRKDGRTFSGSLVGDIYSKIDSVFDRQTPYTEASTPERQAQVWQKSTNLKAQAKKYFQENPKANSHDARRWLSDAISDEVRLRAAKSLGGR